jgi:hypothetical protein
VAAIRRRYGGNVGAVNVDAVRARGRFGSVSRGRRGVGLPGALG